MDHRTLGRTDLRVSALCLGTMTWGEQNTEADGHAQMDFAVDHGVTFFDTAEMYSVPPREETYGRTEEIIGSWLATRGKRDRVILATKVVGPGPRFPYVRGGAARLDRANVTAALDASLSRLQTDYVDLYQLHWPDRSVNMFGRRGFRPSPDEEMTPLEETLEVLADLVRDGKVRHVGVSNETPWGVMTFLRHARERDWPRMVSIQNPYNLLNRTFEIGLAEVALREACGLLAYAPIAAGVLSGKYLGGARPPGARMTLFPTYDRYLNASGEQAVARYLQVARRHGIDPVHMALAFVLRQPFVTAAIVGATSLDYLKVSLGALDVVLTDDVLADIEAVHAAIPDPCP